MTTIAFHSLPMSTIRSPLLATVQGITSQAKKRWLHQSAARQAIMMPAMSPFMTEGTITRWKKKEGEAFSAGDVLLQIESDIAMIDVEAQSAGIIGKILLPDGTTNVPVEQVIALVAKDEQELFRFSAQVPVPPLPSTPSRSFPSPLYSEQFNQPFMSPSHRSPRLFEMYATEHGPRHTNIRGMLMKHPRSPGLTITPPSPQMEVQIPFSSVPLNSPKAHRLHPGNNLESNGNMRDDSQLDGAAIRRMIMSNLARTPSSGEI